MEYKDGDTNAEEVSNKYVRIITQAINNLDSGSVSDCDCIHFGNTWC